MPAIQVEAATKSKEVYTVTFDSNGGSVVPSQQVMKTKKLSRPADPVKEGYSFENWYRDKKCTKLYNFDAAVTKSFTLYANWLEGDISDPPSGPDDAEKDDDKDNDKDNVPDTLEEFFGTSAETDDTDGDGLTDYTEIYDTDTDPTIADTDNNDILDSEEDSDGDGLNNIEEQKIGTSSRKLDTDNDGLSDGEEVNAFGTDPLKYDTDGDGLSDGEEIQLGLDPLKQKSDGITDDAQRTFYQVTDSSVMDEALIDSDNWLTPIISGEVSGVLTNNVFMSQAIIHSYSDNRAVVSDMIDVDTTYDVPLTLSFELEYDYTGVLENLTIVKFADDGLELVETVISVC